MRGISRRLIVLFIGAAFMATGIGGAAADDDIGVYLSTYVSTSDPVPLKVSFYLQSFPDQEVLYYVPSSEVIVSPRGDYWRFKAFVSEDALDGLGLKGQDTRWATRVDARDTNEATTIFRFYASGSNAKAGPDFPVQGTVFWLVAERPGDVDD